MQTTSDSALLLSLIPTEGAVYIWIGQEAWSWFWLTHLQRHVTIAVVCFWHCRVERTGQVVEQRWAQPACLLYLTRPETAAAVESNTAVSRVLDCQCSFNSRTSSTHLNKLVRLHITWRVLSFNIQQSQTVQTKQGTSRFQLASLVINLWVWLRQVEHDISTVWKKKKKKKKHLFAFVRALCTRLNYPCIITSCNMMDFTACILQRVG